MTEPHAERRPTAPRLHLRPGTTPREPIRRPLLHEAFEAQVARTPDAPAIRFRDEALTYRELNVRANQLAEHLIELGAGPDILVAICMDRSLEMVVALYAILKSGSAYVPIDPEYPADRVSLHARRHPAPRSCLRRARWQTAFSDTAAAIRPGRPRIGRSLPTGQLRTLRRERLLTTSPT